MILKHSLLFCIAKTLDIILTTNELYIYLLSKMTLTDLEISD